MATSSSTRRGRQSGADLKPPQAAAVKSRGCERCGNAEETSLGLRTVGIIVDQGDGRDRTSIKHLEPIDPERQLEASWRARTFGQR